MTFEEWVDGYHQIEDAWEMNIARDAWNASAYALNSELGVSSNEAAKAERRKVAVAKYLATSSMRLTREQMDELIKVAQG